jgi:hypothetical protein
MCYKNQVFRIAPGIDRYWLGRGINDPYGSGPLWRTCRRLSVFPVPGLSVSGSSFGIVSGALMATVLSHLASA